jgi:hypothetical protein
MRFLVPVFALALAACTQPATAPAAAPSAETAATQPAGCTREVTRNVRFSDDDTDDTLTVSASGPACGQAVLHLTIRAANGDPLWAFATIWKDMGRSENPTPQDVDAFLAQWATVELKKSGTLPEWREGAGSLEESEQGGSMSTPYGREAYEALRARDLPLLCFLNSMESSQCLIVDPASHAPTAIIFMGA